MVKYEVVNLESDPKLLRVKQASRFLSEPRVNTCAKAQLRERLDAEIEHDESI